MRKKTYEKRMLKHEERFNKLWEKIVEDTNTYVAKNPEKTMYRLTTVEKFVNNLCLSGAWIFDRNNHKFPRDRGSLTKKIRKSLGYTFP